MEDIIKKVLYTGVGLVTLTAEKLQEAVDDLVDKNKMSEEEGKKVVDDFQEKTNSYKEDLEDKFKGFAQDIRDAFDFPSKKDWTQLLERVEAIEEKLGAKEDVKKVVKKQSPKKTKE